MKIIKIFESNISFLYKVIKIIHIINFQLTNILICINNNNCY